jgi:hypothetical protein
VPEITASYWQIAMSRLVSIPHIPKTSSATILDRRCFSAGSRRLLSGRLTLLP